MTKLAQNMGMIIAPGVEPLTPKAKRRLNEVLRDLDEEERQSLVLMGAAGRWDWHMVDGTDRIWHFTAGGELSWNMLNDNDERLVMRRAQDLRR